MRRDEKKGDGNGAYAWRKSLYDNLIRHIDIDIDIDADTEFGHVSREWAYV